MQNWKQATNKPTTAQSLLFDKHLFYPYLHTNRNEKSDIFLGEKKCELHYETSVITISLKQATQHNPTGTSLIWITQQQQQEAPPAGETDEDDTSS